MVPPLMLITFIENAFKHGISYQHPSFIEIKAHVEDDQLHFSCQNSKAEKSNKEKGGVARKACKAACIGCGKCAKVCKFDAITVADNLCYIDYTKCKACGQCYFECPTGAIHVSGFEPKKVEPKPAPAAPAAAPATPAAAPAPAVEPVKKEVDNG